MQVIWFIIYARNKMPTQMFLRYNGIFTTKVFVLVSVQLLTQSGNAQSCYLLPVALPSGISDLEPGFPPLDLGFSI